MKKHYVWLMILYSFCTPGNAGWFEFEQLLISLKLKKPYEDVGEKYKKLVNEALQCMDYQGVEIPVKRFARPEDGYNCGCGVTTGKIIFLLTEDDDPDNICLQNFYKKFNENSIVITSANSFVIYHEVAHVVLDHVKKRGIAGLKFYVKNFFVYTIMYGLIYKGLSKIAPKQVSFITENSFASFFLLESLSLLSVFTAFKQILPMCREQELEADELAMRSLCNNGNKHAVKDEIDNLERKARSVCEDFLKGYEPNPDHTMVFAHGLAFQLDPQSKSIGDVIGYVDDDYTHPSFGRRYFLWKEILEEYENQS